MIKLSSLLEHILDHPMKGEAIQEAKRLESLETPRINAERKSIVNDDGYKVYIIVDERGCCVDWYSTRRDADLDARNRTEDTGQTHTVCQVMAPVNGECPTVPVATFTPEREHEWVIFRPTSYHKLWSWAARITDGGYWWCNDPLAPSILKFTSSKEAQEYIDNAQKQHYNIDMLDAFPWPVPKLSEK